jgi:hypothetical protein
MKGWNKVSASVDKWQGSQVWVQADPSASEEFVEDIILLSVSVQESGADQVNLNLRLLIECQSILFNLLNMKVLWQWHSTVDIVIGVWRSINVGAGVAPDQG